MEKPLASLPPKAVNTYLLRNRKGMQVEIVDFGARIHAIYFPAAGGAVNTVLSYPQADDYLGDPYFMGCILGRYCNRIANAAFVLEGKLFKLEQNDGTAHLHGGSNGFHNRFWQLVDYDPKTNRVSLTLFSSDGDGGYPGNLQATVGYHLTDDNAIEISYEAETDSVTPVNLTNHAHFNLSGGRASIEDHQISINASHFLPITGDMIPHGDWQTVANTVFDFRQPSRLRDRLQENHSQTALADGFDHNFILDKHSGDLVMAANAYCLESDILLEVHTTQPGVQFYTGNNLAKPFIKRMGFCLETQHFPNSPNEPTFPSTLLRPGQSLHERTVYAFSRGKG